MSYDSCRRVGVPISQNPFIYQGTRKLRSWTTSQSPAWSCTTRPELFVLVFATSRSRVYRFRSLHSPKLKWKSLQPPVERTVVLIEHFLGFHVSFREGRVYSRGSGHWHSTEMSEIRFLSSFNDWQQKGIENKQAPHPMKTP